MTLIQILTWLLWGFFMGAGWTFGTWVAGWLLGKARTVGKRQP